ncbi:hypothetical protein CFH90_12130 [Acinetobacter johnsonii]|uniref:Uncharacterized protein n=1 Tax=Acinetobacter johnsonii TaxID=40214 RepID=A0A3Q8XEX0_ACIJO|nr:hypothetical protein CFH90_12130 [Acinetobacter johnsonii]
MLTICDFFYVYQIAVAFDWGTKKVENRANEVGFENFEEIRRFSFEFWSIELTQLYKTSRVIVNLISQKWCLIY